MISIVIQIFEYEKGSGDRLYLEHGLFSFFIESKHSVGELYMDFIGLKDIEGCVEILSK